MKGEIEKVKDIEKTAIKPLLSDEDTKIFELRPDKVGSFVINYVTSKKVARSRNENSKVPQTV